MKKCEHNHECEQCIRTEIQALEGQIAVLKQKLPVCTHNHYHWNQTLPNGWCGLNMQVLGSAAGGLQSFNNSIVAGVATADYKRIS